MNRKIQWCVAAATLGASFSVVTPSWAELRQDAPATAKHPMDALTSGSRTRPHAFTHGKPRCGRNP